jgi:tryptophan synthase beta chain
VWVDDAAALEAFQWVARSEGILPALESAHAAAWVRRSLNAWAPGTVVLVNLSGRGDKDVESVRQTLEATA